MVPPSSISSVTASSVGVPSSSVFDASVEQVWISFPEPPNHGTAFKRARSSTTAGVQPESNEKRVFSYTRYDWNFFSTLSPTALSWFCVIDRLKKPFKSGLKRREKHLDTVLAYFLIETELRSTLPVSKYHELFTPKTRYLLAHPVCQLICEIRKNFNHHSQMSIDLRSTLVPETELLKQGIREACRGWAQIFKEKATVPTRPVKGPMFKKHKIETEHPSASPHTPMGTDRVQHPIGHEFVIAHPSRPSVSAKEQHPLLNQTETTNVPLRRRMTTTLTRSPVRDEETRINMNPELHSVSRQRRASSFIGKEKPFSPREHGTLCLCSCEEC